MFLIVNRIISRLPHIYIYIYINSIAIFYIFITFYMFYTILNSEATLLLAIGGYAWWRPSVISTWRYKVARSISAPCWILYLWCMMILKSIYTYFFFFFFLLFCMWSNILMNKVLSFHSYVLNLKRPLNYCNTYDKKNEKRDSTIARTVMYELFPSSVTCIC